MIALAEERWDAAIWLFQEVVRIAPNEAKSHYLLVRVLLGANRLEAAQIEITRARELEPKQPEFDTNRGANPPTRGTVGYARAGPTGARLTSRSEE